MIVPFTSIEIAYKDWYNRQIDPDNVPGERWVYAVINDCVEGLLRGDNIPTILTLEEVKNGIIPLPKGYYEINQAMYVCYRKPIKREFIIEYMKDVYLADCNMIYTLECKVCNTAKCNCDQTCSCKKERCTCKNYITKEEYPEHFLKGNPQYDHHVTGMPQLGCVKDIQGFRPMLPAQGSFFNTNHKLKTCMNLNTDMAIQYLITHDGIEVNFEKGWVLLSYRGYLMEGSYYKIPDHPKVFSAISLSIDFWRAYAEYMTKPSNELQAKLNMVRPLMELAVQEAKNILSHISWDRWEQIAQQFNQLIPMNGSENLYRNGGDIAKRDLW